MSPGRVHARVVDQLAAFTYGLSILHDAQATAVCLYDKGEDKDRPTYARRKGLSPKVSPASLVSTLPVEYAGRFFGARKVTGRDSSCDRIRSPASRAVLRKLSWKSQERPIDLITSTVQAPPSWCSALGTTHSRISPSPTPAARRTCASRQCYAWALAGESRSTTRKRSHE